MTTDGNLDWTSFIRVPASQKQVDKYSLRPGDILFNSTNSPDLVGKTTAFPGHSEPVVFSNHFVRLRADESRLDPYYLARWFTFSWGQRVFESLCTQWVNQASVRKDDLLALEVPLPPLPEQQRIARILAKAGRVRRLRRFARQQGDGYLQSVFLQMFGDSSMGANNTPLVPLDQLCTKITDGTHKTPKYQNSGVPFLSVKNITRELGRLDFSDVKYISLEEHRQISKRCNVEVDDILYTKVGTYGIPQIVDTDIEFSIFVSVALLKPDKTVIMPKYLEAALRTDFVKTQAARLVSGIGVPDLHLREIKTIHIPLPAILRQREYVGIVRKYERVRAQQREAERQAEHLFQSLLHRAFQGEL